MIQILYTDINSIDDKSYQLLFNDSSKDRREKASRFMHSKDQIRCIISEHLIKYAYFSVYNKAFTQAIHYSEYGKPYLPNHDTFHFNISHSGKWVILGYAKSNLGTDIEKIPDKYQNEYKEIVDSFYTCDEQKYILKTEAHLRQNLFTQIWTMKESYLKYIGTGLYKDLNSFSVDPFKNCVYTNGEKISGLSLFSFSLESEYYISVCTTEKHYSIKEIPPKQLQTAIQDIAYK